MKTAEKNGATTVWIIGAQERNNVVRKIMGGSQEEISCPLFFLTIFGILIRNSYFKSKIFRYN